MTTPPDTLLSLLLSGQYLPAIGLALIALVATARVVLAKRFAFFAGKAGGYVLGFGAAFATDIAAALQAGTVPDLALLAHALGIGWAAAGGLEMVRDLLAASKSRPPSSSSVALVLAVVALVGCSSGCKPPDLKPTATIVDCTLASEGELGSLLKEFKSLLVGELPNWTAIKEKAINAGKTIGGCALATFVQEFLAGRRLTPLPPESTRAAAATLETYRRDYAGGATFRTRAGDL